MDNRETYKIIKIVDEYSVVINAGSSQSVKVNDTFEIFIIGEPIIDPETKAVLGTLDTIKAKLKVKQIFEYFSVCINYETTTSNMNYIFTQPFTSTAVKRLNVDSSQISGGYLEEDLKIQIGDHVRKSL